jgi:hypothetical protein
MLGQQGARLLMVVRIASINGVGEDKGILPSLVVDDSDVPRSIRSYTPHCDTQEHGD